MATAWVLGKVSDALAPTVSNTVSTAGGFAGGAVNAVGSSVNGVGDGINRYIKGYGDGAKDYGNAIMDWTAADGIRGATAANPLGLTGGKTGGKRAVTSPQVYHAPASSASKTLTTTSKSTPQKKVGGPKPTTNATTPSVKAAAAGKKIGAPAGTAKKPVQKSAATSTGKKTAVVPPKKAMAPAAPKPKAHQPAAYMSSKSASNPVGVSW